MPDSQNLPAEAQAMDGQTITSTPSEPAPQPADSVLSKISGQASSPQADSAQAAGSFDKVQDKPEQTASPQGEPPVEPSQTETASENPAEAPANAQPVSEQESAPANQEAEPAHPEAGESAASAAVEPAAPLSVASSSDQHLPTAVVPAGAAPAVAAPAAVKSLLQRAKEVLQLRKRKKLEKILALVKAKRNIANDDVQKLLRVSDATATRYLAQLVQEGKLRRIGPPKGARYELAIS